MLNETMEHELVREDQANPLLMRTFSIIIPAYNEVERNGHGDLNCQSLFRKAVVTNLAF